MNTAVLLVAAGRGTRLGSNRPKALVEVAGRSLLDRALEGIARWPSVARVLVTAPESHVDEFRVLAEAAAFDAVDVVRGGATRQESVRRALDAAPSELDVVLCHDVARPFASAALAAAAIEALADAEGAVPAVPVSDTVKRVSGRLVVDTVAREDLVAVQTPQAFRREALDRAHREAAAEGATGTDDAALLERLGMRVAVVAGDPLNIKVTIAEDIAVAEAIAVRLRHG